MTKDYSDLIGKKFGDRTVLDVFKKKVELKTSSHMETYARCECKCGSIDEVPISRLKRGARLRCTRCVDAKENKSTGIRNISYDRFNDRFAIVIARNGQKIFRYTHTLDEALLTKQLLLEHFEKYGCFDIEKLNESYYTCEPKKCDKRRRTKDYSHLIGQTFGDRKILNIIKKNNYGCNVQYAICKCKCGREHEVEVSQLLSHKYRQKCLYCRANTTKPTVRNKLGIRNISFDEHCQVYRVDVRRNHKCKRGVATTLSKAKALKEQFLKEFENEAKAHD